MTAAYMRILIHTMNNSLFPDADPSSVTWTGPPPEIVTVQSLLYSSLATSLFAAFIAMFGKQWINRYLRKHGGSAAEKCRDRQRKLEGFKEWHFQLAIESLPVMLQLALLLLGCALTLHLWTVSRTVAGVILAFTLSGITSYTFFTLVATFHYNCPYQTPASIIVRTIYPSLARSDFSLARSLRPLTSSLPSTKGLGRLLGYLLYGLRRGSVEGFHCGSTEEGTEGIVPLVFVPSTRIFEDTLKDTSLNLEVLQGDSRCIWWVLNYTTEPDVILPTARFAADIVWHPEIAGAVSPHVLADLFFDCLLNGQVISGKSEHASAIGMGLASVISTRLVTEPENQELVGLCGRVRARIALPSPSDPTSLLVTNVLRIVVERVLFGRRRLVPIDSTVDRRMVHQTPTTKKLWLSRVMLQHLWWQRHLKGSTVVLRFHPFSFLEEGGMSDGENTPDILKTSCFLAMAISLGLQVDRHDLYPPNTMCVPSYFFHVFR